MNGNPGHVVTTCTSPTAMVTRSHRLPPPGSVIESSAVLRSPTSSSTVRPSPNSSCFRGAGCGSESRQPLLRCEQRPGCRSAVALGLPPTESHTCTERCHDLPLKHDREHDQRNRYHHGRRHHVTPRDLVTVSNGQWRLELEDLKRYGPLFRRHDERYRERVPPPAPGRSPRHTAILAQPAVAHG